MEPEYDNRNAPSYLAHYGMHRPPFATQTEDEMYYSEPTRNKRLDILLHLTQYGNELLLVTGAQGSGKTTLLQQFLKKAQENWKVCSLNADSKTDPEQLLYRICHCFNFKVESAALPFIVTNVKRQLDEMLADSQTVIIAIDNAHTFSTAVLSLLAEFSKIKNLKTGAYLRIVLFAEPQIKIQFATLELENKLKYPARKIDLPPFDEKQTGELIRHRTKIAGLKADNTFTDAAISKIYRQSEGIPGNIIELAHRVLFEMTPLKRRTKPNMPVNSKTTNSMKLVRLMAAILIIIAITLILVFQKQINRLYSKKHRPATPAEQTITSESTQAIDGNLVQHFQSAANDNTTAEKTTASSKSESVAIFAKDTVNEIAAINTEGANSTQDPSAVSLSSKTDSAKSSSDKIQSEQTRAGEAQPSESANLDFETAPEKPESVAANTPSHNAEPAPATEQDQPLVAQIHHEDWLMEQDPNFFTVQLVAGYQKSTVNNFLKKHELSGDNLAYFHSLNKGKDWNSLVYGIYPDYRRATLAIDDLPVAIRNSRPWIRKLGSVQWEIKEAKK